MLLILVLTLSTASPVDEVLPSLREFVTDEIERGATYVYALSRLKQELANDAKLQKQVLEHIEANLSSKPEHFPMTVEQLKHTVVDYEIFKMKTFLSSGVFPKRYFGYFDEEWDTAKYERLLRETTHAAVLVINASQERAGSSVRVNDAEIAVTFIAEGGAILLREKQSDLENIHPVYGVGLDDIALGSTQYAALAKELDAALGTRLQDIVMHTNGNALLRRNMTFKEAVLGTALMYVYEKEIASKKLKAQNVDLASLSLDQQFVVGSLVYNSGLTFSATSREQILAFAAGKDLHDLAIRNARKGLLPVIEPTKALARMRAGGEYPEQPTTWSAMYHVLQRYGGYQALRRFTDVFDARGMFRRSLVPGQ